MPRREVVARFSAFRLELLARVAPFRRHFSCHAQVQRAAAEAFLAELRGHDLDVAFGDADVGDVVADLDGADLAAGDVGFVGDRSDDVGGADAFAFSDAHHHRDGFVGFDGWWRGGWGRLGRHRQRAWAVRDSDPEGPRLYY